MYASELRPEEKSPEPGDWVLVWAQVKRQEGVHPEDFRVQFDSHNASPEATVMVRLDRVLIPDERPPFARICTAMYSAMGGLCWRCTKAEDHSGKHVSNNGSLTWGADQVAGHIEEID